MKQNSLDGLQDKIAFLLDSLESEEKFKYPGENKLFILAFHLYAKAKRLYMTSHFILKSPIECNYLDVMPLIRILCETYFHVAYIEKNINNGSTFMHYENMGKLNNWKLGRSLDKWGNEKIGGLHPFYSDFVDENYKGKAKPTVPPELTEFYKLAQSVGRYDFYMEIYSVLSSFIHFDPSTLSNYGSVDGDSFVFNKMTHNEELDKTVREHLIRIMLLLTLSVIHIFELNEFERETFDPILKDWEHLRKI